jgi:hypothetical protein
MPETGERGNGRSLTLEALATAKRLPMDFLRGLGLRDLPQGGVVIPYFDRTGEQLFIRERESPRCGKNWFSQPAGIPLAAYGQWKLHEGEKAGIIILVEGESDCWALWHHSLPALGIPGANAS